MLDTVTFGSGLFIGALLLGVRHGFDWDHIIAITDIASTQQHRRRGLILGTAYVLGHAFVILVLGTVAVLFGSKIPPGFDAVMGRVVGVTLTVLGIAVLATVFTDRKAFTAKSRWLLLFSGVGRLFGRVRTLLGLNATEEHEHSHDAVHHDGPSGAHDGHSHIHSHDVSGATGLWSTVGIGVLHGVGAQTPTQVLLFLAAATAGGNAAGIGALVAFVIGLVLANSVITVVAASGLSVLTNRPGVQITLGIIAGTASIAIGVLFFIGSDAGLPTLFT